MDHQTEASRVSTLIGKLDYVKERLAVRTEHVEHYPWMEKKELDALLTALWTDLQQKGVEPLLHHEGTGENSTLSQGISRLMKRVLEIAEGLDDQPRIRDILEEAERLEFYGGAKFARTVAAASELRDFVRDGHADPEHEEDIDAPAVV